MIQEVSQEIKNTVLGSIRDLHTALPGKIISFNPENCEADILPFGKFIKPDNSLMDYPLLNRVPVYVMQGCDQTATIAYPINPGDECLIIFSEQTLDTWRTKAESSTDLKFDLSNAVAIIGMFAKPNPLVKEACLDNSIIIEKDGERIRLKKGETYIKDTSGQSIHLKPEGMFLKAKNLTLESAGFIDISASGNVAISGSRIDLN